ncbi:MAG: CHAT domain-containing protein [Desulfobacterales bacterium]|nr:CHAT domain-containing protein [Desulfobacterales bacterium]
MMKKQIFTVMFSVYLSLFLVAGVIAELTTEEFIKQLSEATEKKDYEKSTQLVRQNPNTAKQAFQVLQKQGQGERETAETTKNIGNQLYKVLQYLQESEKKLEINRLLTDGEKALYASKYQDALTKFKKSLELAEESGNMHAIATSVGNIGTVYIHLGQYEKALSHFEEALLISYEIGDKVGAGLHIGNIGVVYGNIGENKKALEYHEQALEGHRKIKEIVLDREGINLGNIGNVYMKLAQYKDALSYYEQALMIHKETGNKRREGDNLSGIGRLYTDIGQYEKAFPYYEQALAIHKEIGYRAGESNDLNGIGLVYEFLDQYDRALSYYKQSLEIDKEIGLKEGEGINLSNIGVVYRKLGQYKKALSYYEKALAIRKKVRNRAGEGDNLTNIANVYNRLRQYEKALNFYEQALVIHRETGDRKNEGLDLANIGVVYSDLGQNEKALQHYEQALEIHSEIEDQRSEAIALTNIGVEYFSLGQYEKALSYHKQALAIYRKIGDRSGESDNLSSLGNVYYVYGQYEKALEFDKQALAISKEIKSRRNEALDLYNIGVVYKKLGQYKKAISYFQNSLAIYKEINTFDIWRAQYGIASSNANLKQFKTAKTAISYYEEALDNIEAIRTSLSKNEHKIFFLKDKLHVYDGLTGLLQKLHIEDPGKGYDHEALYTFERKQGRSFFEQMGQSGARRFAGIPEDITQNELNLKNQIVQIRRKLIDERSKTIMKQNRKLIKKLEHDEKTFQIKQETLQATIKTKYPDYYSLRYPEPVALSDLQSVLKQREIMFVYGVMKKKTVLWILDKQDLKLITLNISEDKLRKQINELRKIFNDIGTSILNEQQLEAIKLANKTLDGMLQDAYKLYQRLFPESIRALITQNHTLYIVPTGPLYGIPFEMLVTEAPETGKTPSYLMKNCPIAYLSSASLLKILRDAQARRKQTTRYPLLAFANPIYTDGEKDIAVETQVSKADTSLTAGMDTVQGMRSQIYLTLMGGNDFKPLPKTEEEAEEIAKILEAPENSEPLQLREKATCKNIMNLNAQQRLDDYRYLLFSAHAVLAGEIDHVNQPAIVLSHPKNDGYLTMSDVFGLQLNADLVVLSACNTGMGELIRGEGIMGLTRAFMYAGTPAVNVTLWSVDANASYEINTRMFRHIKAGKPIADALRQAKLDLIAEAEEDEDMEHFRHPFFWSPFVVFGDDAG